MTHIPSRPPIPHFPIGHLIDVSGRYEVHVDSPDGTRTVLWVDNHPGARMERFRAAGPLRWWTLLDIAAGTMIQLESDCPDARLTVRPEPSDDQPPDPLPTYGIGIGVAGGAL